PAPLLGAREGPEDQRHDREDRLAGPSVPDEDQKPHRLQELVGLPLVGVRSVAEIHSDLLRGSAHRRASSRATATSVLPIRLSWLSRRSSSLRAKCQITPVIAVIPPPSTAVRSPQAHDGISTITPSPP